MSVAALALAALAAPLGVAAGDDDDDDRFGAWIYAGTPGEFGGDPVASIGGLERIDDDDDDDIDWLDSGTIDATVIWEEEEDIDASLDTLMAEPHVVVVRADDNRDADTLAVGEIAGEVDDRGNLTIILEPVDDSGIAGMAHFDPEDDDDDDELDVSVVVWEGNVPNLSTPAN
jgi:hypothetical protein